MKATAIAPSNIAFVKYWGRKNETLRLPENGSISMTLSNLTTTTTVEFNPEFHGDTVTIDGTENTAEAERVSRHLNTIRSLARIDSGAHVVSRNSFPSGTGLSSSASGFAALTVAATQAAGLHLSERELSVLARQGSGSACRSIPSGFVEWMDGDTSETSFAQSIFPDDYWQILDVVAVVSEGKKEVSTSEGQKLVQSSPFFYERLRRIPQKIATVKEAIRQKAFSQLGEITEAEALEMHAVMITSRPALLYWTMGTLAIMKLVPLWRKGGLEVYFTVNTGQDIHLLCLPENRDVLVAKLRELPYVKDIIVNTPCPGTKVTETHLF